MPSSASTDSAQNLGRDGAPETVLRIGPQYRRCCWYLFASSWLMMGAALLVRQQAGYPISAGPGFAVALLPPALTLLFLLTAESWRMRVDSQGISRRRWWFWSTWPWVAFRAGRIYRHFKSGRYVYICSDRPWGDRQLYFDWLADNDRTFVDQFCRQALLSPAIPSAAPVEIVAHRRGRFTSEGVYLSLPWEMQPQPPVPWSHVEMLRLHWRLAEDGVTCRAELQIQNAKPQWAFLRQLDAIAPTGEKYRLANEWEQVEQFIAPRLERERFASYQVFDSPRNPEEAAYQVDYFRRRLQSARRCYLALNALGFAAAGGLFVGKIIPGFKTLWTEPFLAWPWKVAISACGVLIVLTGPMLLAGLAWLSIGELNKKIARAKAVLANPN